MSAESSWLWAVLTPLVWWVRRCQTQKARVSGWEKLWRAALMVPAFGLLFLILRIRLLLIGPIEVEANTSWGGQFRCRPPDLIQMYLWLFGVWEPDVTHYVRANLRPGDVFVDVGANIGYDAVLAARTTAGGEANLPTVVAIEASSNVSALLQESIVRNGVERQVRPINKAASDAPGKIDVYAGPLHNIGLTTTVQQRGFASHTTVEALPLDELLSHDEIRRARIIKIDVEGAEDRVLAGMNRIIEMKRRQSLDCDILVELSPQWWSDPSKRPIDVLQPFLDAGFQIHEMANSYWPWRYLWPNDIAALTHCRRDLTKRVKRIDVVLSTRNITAQ